MFSHILLCLYISHELTPAQCHHKLKVHLAWLAHDHIHHIPRSDHIPVTWLAKNTSHYLAGYIDTVASLRVNATHTAALVLKLIGAILQSRLVVPLFIIHILHVKRKRKENIKFNSNLEVKIKPRNRLVLHVLEK
jgi:hypothetical protein